MYCVRILLQKICLKFVRKIGFYQGKIRKVSGLTFFGHVLVKFSPVKLFFEGMSRNFLVFVKYLCIYLCLSVFICVYLCLSVFICVYLYLSVYLSVFIYISVFTCVFINLLYALVTLLNKAMQFDQTVNFNFVKKVKGILKAKILI